jgi:SAM-dependent methyltransferase
MSGQLEAAVADLDDLVLLGLADHLARSSRWGAPGATAAGIADDLGVAPRFRWVLGLWTTALRAHGVDGRPRRAELVDARHRMEAARRVLGYGPELADLLLRSLRLLPELLTGAVGVQALLYPDGDIATAEVAYRTNAASAYLNSAAASAATRTAQRAGHPVRVLELGAGIGATTADLLPALAAHPVAEYRYTDLSPFFLDGARRRFAAYPFLRPGLLDVDDAGEHVAGGGFDLVVAATMAHNARDVDRLLAAVAAGLVPGGRLLLIEPVREHAQSLTSMPFALSTAHGPPVRTDLRAGTTRTYLDRAEWLAALDRAGLRVEADLPGRDHPLAAFSQCLFVAVRDPRGSA